ncbi:hypothetical protein BA70_15005 [Bacillus zhangzhouensis]|uniref:Uncharacterized protein n=2 Tax=Bacillus TaxID=1386 RepID=A0A081L6F6_9BACI|nr:hypothetical protein BA70_15005 [Bacillus zhangzhouensis]
MRLPRWIFLGTILYLVAFLIDYITTLFSIDKSGVYMSKLGLKIDMTMNEEELYTNFSFTSQILIIYIIYILFIIALFAIVKFKKTTK